MQGITQSNSWSCAVAIRCCAVAHILEYAFGPENRQNWYNCQQLTAEHSLRVLYSQTEEFKVHRDIQQKGGMALLLVQVSCLT